MVVHRKDFCSLLFWSARMQSGGTKGRRYSLHAGGMPGGVRGEYDPCGGLVGVHSPSDICLAADAVGGVAGRTVPRPGGVSGKGDTNSGAKRQLGDVGRCRRLSLSSSVTPGGNVNRRRLGDISSLCSRQFPVAARGSPGFTG